MIGLKGAGYWRRWVHRRSYHGAPTRIGYSVIGVDDSFSGIPGNLNSVPGILFSFSE